MKHKIIIDNKEVEISEEDYQQLTKEYLAKDYTNWEYPFLETYYVDGRFIINERRGTDEYNKKLGLYRKTEKNALHSFARMLQSNRLEALVEQIQGDLKGEASIYKYGNDHYAYYEDCDGYDYIGSIKMQPDTAETICKLLNNGKFTF